MPHAIVIVGFDAAEGIDRLQQHIDAVINIIGAVSESIDRRSFVAC
jgi:hypothetical protein